ncbi:lysM and putative peptidoglycan-binding domain-containing protein 1 [Ixodes scapularis]
MSVTGGNETALLGSFAKKQTKYGSTCKHVLRAGKTIKHMVQPHDTLQGLALRYGVTMEEIKRENRLWTSDSLFLRPWLAIPVEGWGSTNCKGASGGTPDTSLEDSEEQMAEESMSDFLCRIDDSIARSKDQVRVLERNRRHPGEDAWQTPRTERLRPGGPSSNDLSSDPSLAPHPVVMSRKVKHSLQRHERDHEEIFQL